MRESWALAEKEKSEIPGPKISADNVARKQNWCSSRQETGSH